MQEGAYAGCLRRVLPVGPTGAPRWSAAHHGIGRRHNGAYRGCTGTGSGIGAVEDSGQCSGRSDISGPPDDPGGPSSSPGTRPQPEEGYSYKTFVS